MMMMMIRLRGGALYAIDPLLIRVYLHKHCYVFLFKKFSADRVL